MYYEPKQGYHGQFSTDVLIELYFPNQDIGNCVEVGVANGSRGSNTLYFEKKGWETLCIEPNPEYFKIAKSKRKNTVQYACGRSNSKDVPFVVFDIGQRNIMSSVSGLSPDQRLVEDHKRRGLINKTYEIQVEVRTLDSILTEANVNRKIDFISIDTEGTELDVLRGLSLNEWDISLLVVENNYNDPEIEEHLLTQGYVKDARWKINDFYIKENNR